MKLLLIIPAYNEAENIEKVVNDLIWNYPQYDYVVINDGSKDDTAKICRQNEFNLLNLLINIGLSGSFQTGVKYAREKGYDMAMQFDGDGQHDPSFIKKMIDEMKSSNLDIVVGSRFKEKKKTGGLRIIGNNIIQLVVKLTTGQSITDPTSGMRLLNLQMIDKFANNINFAPEPDTIAYLIRCGARVGEVQVEMRERTAGESYLNIKRAIQYMLHMVISIVFIQWFRKKA